MMLPIPERRSIERRNPASESDKNSRGRRRSDRRKGHDRRDPRLYYQSMFFFGTDNPDVLKGRALLVDFSGNGARIQTVEPLEIGSDINFQTSLGDHHVSGKARVVHVTASEKPSFLSHHAGLEFIELDSRERLILEGCLQAAKPRPGKLGNPRPMETNAVNGPART